MGRTLRFIMVVSMLASLSGVVLSTEAVSGQADETTAGSSVGPTVIQITVDGPISPVSADYIEKQIEAAQAEGASLLVLQLDTPGGLVTSTRQIVKALFASDIPVAVHVSPPGARAASAGVFITMAAHVAAMAPGTNIGAAHPVNVGGGNPLSPGKEEQGEGEEEPEGESGREGEGEKQPAQGDADIMGQKVLNDTVAFARSIAERTGRNADWAERAVRESVSVTEKEALELNVIDLVAEDMEELLELMEGMVVTVSGDDITLALSGAQVVPRPMGWRHRVLSSLSDPNIAYILMMLGIYGLFFELANPGVILPGVLGVVFLILAFFSFQVIPINYAGFLLIALAIVLFVLEVKVVSYGMLTMGGAAAMFLGSIMLFENVDPYVKLSRSLILAATIFSAGFMVMGLTLVIRTHKRKPVTGIKGMLGVEGVSRTDLSPEGKVWVHGELWSASSAVKVPAGAKVRVTAVKGMMLEVEGVQEPSTFAKASEDRGARSQEPGEELDSKPGSEPDDNLGAEQGSQDSEENPGSEPDTDPDGK
jgi:membrane-bound serine protease (ClpP class)